MISFTTMIKTTGKYSALGKSSLIINKMLSKIAIKVIVSMYFLLVLYVIRTDAPNLSSGFNSIVPGTSTASACVCACVSVRVRVSVCHYSSVSSSGYATSRTAPLALMGMIYLLPTVPFLSISPKNMIVLAPSTPPKLS